jgi:hypothetical protein
MVIVGLIGATLLYGDGTITPAISVLSAIEGIKLYAPQRGRLVVPFDAHHPGEPVSDPAERHFFDRPTLRTSRVCVDQIKDEQMARNKTP